MEGLVIADVSADWIERLREVMDGVGCVQDVKGWSRIVCDSEADKSKKVMIGDGDKPFCHLSSTILFMNAQLRWNVKR